MYNEYVSDNFYHNQFVPVPIEETPVEIQEKKSGNLFSNFKIPEMNWETLILFGVIFFCIYDEFDTELLLIIGGLFLLGL